MTESTAVILPFWLYWGLIVLVPIVFLLVLRARGKGEAGETLPAPPNPPATGPGILDRLIRAVEFLSTFSGRFVAFWTVITVGYYSYEVVARYGFDSPTNWAHEASFLMFGMMFVTCGAYGYLYRSHVRVDAIYVNLPRRWQLVIDIVTWLLFLVYMIAFIKTSWTFFAQSVDQDLVWFGQALDNETSFSEWRVSYIPIKALMFLAGILLLLQGVADLIRAVREYRNLEADAHA